MHPVNSNEIWPGRIKYVSRLSCTHRIQWWFCVPHGAGGGGCSPAGSGWDMFHRSCGLWGEGWLGLWKRSGIPPGRTSGQRGLSAVCGEDPEDAGALWRQDRHKTGPGIRYPDAHDSPVWGIIQEVSLWFYHSVSPPGGGQGVLDPGFPEGAHPEGVQRTLLWGDAESGGQLPGLQCAGPYGSDRAVW